MGGRLSAARGLVVSPLLDDALLGHGVLAVAGRGDDIVDPRPASGVPLIDVAEVAC